MLIVTWAMLVVGFLLALGYAFQWPRRFWNRKGKRMLVIVLAMALSGTTSSSPRAAGAGQASHSSSTAIPGPECGGAQACPLNSINSAPSSHFRS
jgi:hypothetical protein